ncbi:MAG TPA: 3-phenylpropionate/cinnamic acid dioxygenase subunit beta [Phenylobacterium sp.]
MERLTASRRVTCDLQREIEQFLYFEAALLDAHDLDAWYALLADDLRYVMPIRSTRAGRDRGGFSGPRDLAYFDESKASMGLRIRRLHTGSAWAEEPRSRTRHLVSNVRLAVAEGEDEGEDEVEAACAFLVYRNRAEAQTDIFVGERFDRLRRVDTPAGFQIVSRRILLDQAMLLANNISFFF